MTKNDKKNYVFFYLSVFSLFSFFRENNIFKRPTIALMGPIQNVFLFCYQVIPLAIKFL